MSDQEYIGKQDAGSNVTDFNHLDFIVRQVIAQMRTATLCKIVRPPYDKDGNDIPKGSIVPVGYVDVLPLVNQLDGQNNAILHDTVYHLSYHRLQGGGDAFIIDPEKDDIGLMVVGDRDHSSVKATDKQANPGSRRKFDLADGTYYGVPQGKKPDQGVRFTAKGMIWFDKNGNTITTDDKGIIIDDHVNGNNITMGSDGVNINGAVISKAGDVTTKHGTSLDHHVNTNVTAGTDNTGPPP